ncbi:hypothetical protein JYU16_01730 [bacterium AH-315-M05]|nr:hypothetical protein [bacterium AH-315-M05]
MTAKQLTDNQVPRINFGGLKRKKASTQQAHSQSRTSPPATQALQKSLLFHHSGVNNFISKNIDIFTVVRIFDKI